MSHEPSQTERLLTRLHHSVSNRPRSNSTDALERGGVRRRHVFPAEDDGGGEKHDAATAAAEKAEKQSFSSLCFSITKNSET